MATGIPTFRVDLAEGMIDVSTSADRLFAYCVEADKGPINVPTFVASNKECTETNDNGGYYAKPSELIFHIYSLTIVK